MLKTFDNSVTLAIDEILVIERVEREDYGYRQYIVHFRGGRKHVIWCEPFSITLEEMYPELTAWVRNFGKAINC